MYFSVEAFFVSFEIRSSFVYYHSIHFSFLLPYFDVLSRVPFSVDVVLYYFVVFGEVVSSVLLLYHGDDVVVVVAIVVVEKNHSLDLPFHRSCCYLDDEKYFGDEKYFDDEKYDGDAVCYCYCCLDLG